MPRRLTAPEPPLSDDAVLLEPLGRRHVGEFGWAVDGDPGIIRFTRVPSSPGADFLDVWLGGYEDAWDEGTKAGFAIRAVDDGALLGFAGIVALDLAGLEGEIGYALRRESRGRGAATRSVWLLTRWALEDLGLQRVELRIDVENTASQRVAGRCGYRLDGVLRSLHVKEGLRADVGVWSRLASD